MEPKDVKIGEIVQINWPSKEVPSDEWGGKKGVAEIRDAGVIIVNNHNIEGLIPWRYIEKLRIDNWKKVIENG